MFYFLCVVVYHLCETYYKLMTTQYGITDCVSWVPRLTLFDLQTGLMNVFSIRNSFVCRGLTVQAYRYLLYYFSIFSIEIFS